MFVIKCKQKEKLLFGKLNYWTREKEFVKIYQSEEEAKKDIKRQGIKNNSLLLKIEENYVCNN